MQESANRLSETTPEKEEINSAAICVANSIAIPSESEALVTVMTFKSGLMTTKTMMNQKNINGLLPTRNIEDARPLPPLQLIITDFLRKHVMIHIQMVIAVRTEKINTVVMPMIGDETGQGEGELMTVNVGKEN